MGRDLCVGIRMSVIFGDEAALHKALAKGADINGVDRSGDTHLAWAIRTNRIKGVGLLLDAGADINIRTAHGTAMLPLAEAYKRTEIAALLRERIARNRAAEQQAHRERLREAARQSQKSLREKHPRITKAGPKP